MNSNFDFYNNTAQHRLGFIPADPSSPMEAQSCRSDNIGSGDKLDYSISKRKVQTAGDNHRELLRNIQNAVHSIDLPYRNSRLSEQSNIVIELINELEDGRCPNVAGSFKTVQQSLGILMDLLINQLPENISVLQTLADLGMGIELNSYCLHKVPPDLLRQLLKNIKHETVQAMLRKNNEVLFFSADPAYMDILKYYFTQSEIQRIAQNFMSSMIELPDRLIDYNPSLQCSEGAAPCLFTELLRSLDTRLINPPVSQDFRQSITAALHSELSTLQLCLLEVNAIKHRQLIECGLSTLDDKQRERLLVCAFILGQLQLFELLMQTLPNCSQAIINRKFRKGTNILHVLATALHDISSAGNVYDFEWLNVYSPGYDKLFSYLPAENLANQLDNSGATPLLLLINHHPVQSTRRTLFGADNNLFNSRLTSLIKLTSRENLVSGMQSLLKGNHPLNVFWFSELLNLFNHMQPDRFGSVALGPCEFKYCSYLMHEPLDGANRLFQPVIDFLANHQDALTNKAKAWELVVLIQQSELPVEYLAQVLKHATPDVKKHLLERLTEKPVDRNSLFIERAYKVLYASIYFYPWYLIGLGLGADCAPDPDMAFTYLLVDCVAQFAKSNPREQVPELHRDWAKELANCRDITIYGRSLAFPSESVREGYRRFKFLKQQPGSTEAWHDFIREQPHLEFFRKHKVELGLESALLVPRGIYRLTDARGKLETCGLPDQTLKSIAFEPDGSAYLQVFDDEKNTALYHHYPYQTEGVDGLSVQASFEGLRLFARDAGRLWQHNFQAPDTLSSFHNSADGRTWVPTPFFGGHGLPGTMGEWNAQDYPNIGPAPVGMRDWADIRSFSEHKSTSFGMRESYDATGSERQGQLRITELGKAFYGLVINWLRVRHDRDNLDYTNGDQMNQLAGELIAIAADLFGSAYGMEPEVMQTRIRQELPQETLDRAALECGYWCDPKLRYVQDIKNNRFPCEVYPAHPDQDLNRIQLNPETENLTSQGLRRSSKARGPNLGVDSGTFPLVHLDSLFWFAMLTGWKQHDSVV